MLFLPIETYRSYPNINYILQLSSVVSSNHCQTMKYVYLSLAVHCANPAAPVMTPSDATIRLQD